MIKEYQITLFCEDNTYKPVSTIIKVDTKACAKMHKSREELIAEIRNKGIRQICQKRYWTNADLKRFGYTKIKIREYDKEKIARENAERYERIKVERGWAKPDESATERE